MPIRLPQFLRARRPAMPDRVEIDGGSLPVTVRLNARARRLILRLAPGGEGVVVTLPRGTAPAAVASFLERHRGWIEDRRSRLGGAIRVEPGAVLPFRGRALQLVGDPAPRLLRLEEGEDGLLLRVGGEPQRFARRVGDFLKREARRDLQAAVDRHAASVSLRPASLSLKDTKSRWGSCTSDRRLAFSWRIVMAPPFVLDYLAAHEVAHFVEMNHGPAFWALCTRLCPRTQEARAWLKREGAALHTVDFRPAP
ncbi:SprT family zinc-dependent metalloprotease [Aurantimonas sp. Leaf443]|uniref:M48 family metallopeptidase n=1 Tax=Aurantimonas sp. Leaf443 TaxID=1736378 RepID=UPI0006FC85E5|nr:SprT family zinc-dependent metalloprotease [Aurantimonas sp. Leaf443]KQT83989.1 metal-dependent hydrolase [Aurantimonas sp. Leaf443]